MAVDPGDPANSQLHKQTHDIDKLIAHARAARVDAEVLANLVAETAVENALAKSRFESVRLSPVVQARLCLLLGDGTSTTP